VLLVVAAFSQEVVCSLHSTRREYCTGTKQGKQLRRRGG
jgi:hypothetical protein